MYAYTTKQTLTKLKELTKDIKNSKRFDIKDLSPEYQFKLLRFHLGL